MKIGVIIIFRNNEEEIDMNFIINQSNGAKNLELCLVNNDSKDSTYEVLKEIKEACTNVSVVNIKRLKSDTAAVRAGARYMFNQLDLKHIGYLTTSSLKDKCNTLDTLIKVVSENQSEILKYNIKVRKNREVKQTLFQNLFSIIEYLKKINQGNQFVYLQ
jgi:glycosyltransferase involved in cell wall biosynthesis